MGDASARRHGYVLAALGRFCSAQGLADAPLGHGLVEAFVTIGMAGRASSTQGTYRSVLRADIAAEPPLCLGFSPSPAPRPYSGAEIAELFSLARCQPSAWRRSSALSLLALGIGAGLRPSELAAARGADVIDNGTRVIVRAGRARTVAVGGSWPAVLARQGAAAGTGHLFCPGAAERSYKNFVNNFCPKLSPSATSPRFSSGRARSSYICAHLVAGTPLGELLYLSGICQVESLLRYARLVPGAPASKAELRRKLRSG